MKTPLTSIFVFFIPLFALIQAEGLALVNVNWTAVDGLVESFREAYEVPGLAISISNKSDGTAKGYGLSDREVGQEMDNSTRFLIASISKSFTAVTICRLLSQTFPGLGERALDTPIVDLVPSYNFTLLDRVRTEHATFRDLLSHRMCLNSYGLGVTAGVYKSRADRVYRCRYIGEKCGFRSRFEYSNNMIMLAGEIASHITRRPFENMVMDLMTEIGMKSSLTVKPLFEEDYEALDKMSRGYYRNLDGQLAKINATTFNSLSGAASGGIISTAEDMMRYIQFHLNEGLVDGLQIVPSEVLKWVYKLSNHVSFSGTGKEPFEGDYGYGLGLDIGLYGSMLRIAHNGDLSPFEARITLYPEQGVGIFTANNGPGGLGNHHILHNKITEVLLSPNATINYDFTKKTPVTKTSMPRAELLQTFPRLSTSQRRKQSEVVGTYGHPYEGDITTTLGGSGDGLELEYGIWGKGTLLSTPEENVYSINWSGDIVSMFLSYSGGILPEILWDFNLPGSLFYIDSGDVIEYRLNATLDSGFYPEIPWAPGSCKLVHNEL